MGGCQFDPAREARLDSELWNSTVGVRSAAHRASGGDHVGKNIAQALRAGGIEDQVAAKHQGPSMFQKRLV
jgi:hypothetical protein